MGRARFVTFDGVADLPRLEEIYTTGLGVTSFYGIEALSALRHLEMDRSRPADVVVDVSPLAHLPLLEHVELRNLGSYLGQDQLRQGPAIRHCLLYP